MKRTAAPILILLFLLVALGIFWIFRREGGGTEPAEPRVSARSTATPEPTATPVPAQNTAGAPAVPATAAPTATPAPTAVPTMPPTPTPTPLPTATPEPTPTPVIVRETTGSFRSDTGTWINVVVKYSVQRNGDDAKLILDAYVESYTLQTAQRVDDVAFTVNGRTVYASSGPLDVPESAGKTESLLGSATVDVTPGSEVHAAVTWYFRGSYSGQDIESITAEADLAIP